MPSSQQQSPIRNIGLRLIFSAHTQLFANKITRSQYGSPTTLSNQKAVAREPMRPLNWFSSKWMKLRGNLASMSLDDSSVAWISGIRGGENLNISSMVHKTVITDKQHYCEHMIQTTQWAHINKWVFGDDPSLKAAITDDACRLAWRGRRWPMMFPSSSHVMLTNQ
jgi:hypothetical protein